MVYPSHAPRATDVPLARMDIPVRPTAVAFTGCLTVVAALEALGDPGPGVGLAVLAVVAVLAGRQAHVGQAAVIGAVAWLFDDGFVSGALRPGYQPGVLHWDAGAAVALGVLVSVALAASTAHPSPPPPRTLTASRRRQDPRPER